MGGPWRARDFDPGAWRPPTPRRPSDPDPGAAPRDPAWPVVFAYLAFLLAVGLVGLGFLHAW